MVGSERTLVSIQERGGIPIGQEISGTINGVPVRLDHMWVDVSGERAVLRASEAKFGLSARLTPNQRITFGPTGGQFTFVPTGLGLPASRLAESGLVSGQPVLVEIEVLRWVWGL